MQYIIVKSLVETMKKVSFKPGVKKRRVMAGDIGDNVTFI